MIALFFASLLHVFKRGQVQALRWLLVACVVCLVLATSFGSPTPAPIDTWNTVVLLLPGMLVIGTAYFFILLDRLHLQLRILSNAITATALVLISCPLAGTLLNSHANHAYPPYVPAALKAIGGYVHPGEWITTDMPWATAWYGDHGSMWLPDTLADFNVIYDDYNSSGVLLLTPVLLSQPILSITSGEEKEWFPFVARGSLPPRADAAGVMLEALPLAEMRAEDGRITSDVLGFLSVEASIASRTSYGGTAPDNVRRQAEGWLERLA